MNLEADTAFDKVDRKRSTLIIRLDMSMWCFRSDTEVQEQHR